MNKPERSKYPFLSISESFIRVFNMNQKENEILVNYSKRLKQGKDILEAHVGKDLMGHYVDHINKFKNPIGVDNKKKLNLENLINGRHTY